MDSQQKEQKYPSKVFPEGKYRTQNAEASSKREALAGLPGGFLLDNLFIQVKKYLSDLGDSSKPVSHYLPPSKLKRAVNLELPEEGDLDSLPEWVASYLQHAVKTGSTRFYNQLFSGFSLPGFAADVVTSVTNTSMYTYEVSPLATLIEKELIKTMGQLAGFKDPEGVFVTGGSNANLVALFAARDRLSPTIKHQGTYHLKPLVAFVSKEAHYSFGKAANVMGLGLEHLLKVDTDRQGRMSPPALEEAILEAKNRGEQPFFVGATSGTTVAGSFDPLEDLGAIAKKHGLWFHVDGAWGGSVLMSKRHRHLLAGLEGADSFAWDTHKMMGLPLICSVALFNTNNTKNVLKKLNDISGMEYLFHDEDSSFDLGHLSLQCGRKVDALKLWFAWKCLGRKGFEDNINHLFALSQKAADYVKTSSEYELLYEVASLNICFRYLPRHLKGKTTGEIDTFNLNLRETLLKSGKAIVNYSISDNRPFFRLVLVNFALTEKDVHQFFADLEATAKDLLEVTTQTHRDLVSHHSICKANTSKGGRTASDRQKHRGHTTVFAKQIRAREDAPRPTDRNTKEA